MKVSELRVLSADELTQKIAELRAELVEKQKALHAGELQNPRTITKIRRTIAQAMTLRNQQTAAKEEE